MLNIMINNLLKHTTCQDYNVKNRIEYKKGFIFKINLLKKENCHKNVIKCKN